MPADQDPVLIIIRATGQQPDKDGSPAVLLHTAYLFQAYTFMNYTMNYPPSL